ncbi:Nucleolar Nop52 [Cladophialophora carrionii]|uniref:Nucleolar Nop52 n=1 Tax=Cladophialophora carrionii TaxID=86049 RepID=A0A1C1CU43_9EURO|nr:Nucleolar Nop52 [Cladophialophora carrionii]
MHDSKNALSVQKLIADLAGTVRIMDQKDQQLAPAINAPSQSWLETWMTAFWETLCREWASIDQWRMNKVLLLVRFFIREQFGLALEWAVKEDPKLKDQVARQLRVLEAWPLSPRERKVPDGLRLHVLDVWAEELAGQLSAAQKALDEDAENSDPESKKSILLSLAQEFMEPVRKISREAISKGVKIRAKEAVKLAEEQLSG